MHYLIFTKNNCKYFLITVCEKNCISICQRSYIKISSPNNAVCVFTKPVILNINAYY